MKQLVPYTNLKSTLWVYPSEQGNWYFVTLPRLVAGEIYKTVGKSQRGFGAVKVEVIIGNTSWQTSIFPDKYSQSYILPIKAKVRQVEDLWENEEVLYSLTLI